VPKQSKQLLLDRVWADQHATQLALSDEDRTAINREVADLTWVPVADASSSNPGVIASVGLDRAQKALHLSEVQSLARGGDLALREIDGQRSFALYGVQGVEQDRHLRCYLAVHGDDAIVLGHDVIPTSSGPWPAETQRQRRGHAFYPSRPLHTTGATHDVSGRNIILREHYFAGALDWWIAEAETESAEDTDDPMVLAHGYACLGDPDMAEWGSVNLCELEQIRIRSMFVIERDLDWEPIAAGEVKLPGNPFDS
jgi:hypothetical protein